MVAFALRGSLAIALWLARVERFRYIGAYTSRPGPLHGLLEMEGGCLHGLLHGTALWLESLSFKSYPPAGQHVAASQSRNSLRLEFLPSQHVQYAVLYLPAGSSFSQATCNLRYHDACFYGATLDHGQDG